MPGGCISLQLNACAKLNLVLRVGKRRPDGYHFIDSVMHSITLCDRLSISPLDAIRIVCDHPLVPTGADNLAYKAVLALKNYAGIRDRGAMIHIDKRIPVAAGLGGGSSNAAAVLTGLNRLWNCGLDDKALTQIGLTLGADIPFFVYGGAARVTGIGENVTPITPLIGVPVLIIPFDKGLSTAEVYRAFDDMGVESWAKVESALAALAANDVEALGQALANDLEPVVTRLRPEVGMARDDLLRHGAVGAAMSGSGPTVFGLYRTDNDAVAALNALKARWPGIGLYYLGTGGVDGCSENKAPGGGSR